MGSIFKRAKRASASGPKQYIRFPFWRSI
jgi:hypothetical protein